MEIACSVHSQPSNFWVRLERSDIIVPIVATHASHIATVAIAAIRNQR